MSLDGVHVFKEGHIFQRNFVPLERMPCDKRKNEVVECAILSIKQNLYSTHQI